MTKSKISEIKDRIKKAGAGFKANDNISEFLKDGDLTVIQETVEKDFQKVLESLVIDTKNDPNSKETAKRIAKMFVKEIFAGRYCKMPKVTSFPNVSYDQLYVVGPITIKSTCAHHFQPFNGECYIGVFPGVNVIGLSKFHRICNHFARRPSIQEELTDQIANAVQEVTHAEGVAVMISAKHFCVCNRGVEDEHSEFVTSKVLGTLRDQPMLKDEFFRIVSMKTLKKS